MAATDTFAAHVVGLDSPADHAAAITPDDNADLTNATRSIWVGTAGAGTLKVTMVGGETVTFSGIPDGTMLPIRAVRVFSTGTGASNLVGLW